MTKRSNKILSLVMAVLFILVAFPVIPISAQSATLDDSLVVHWDFEGSTQAEVFSDKSKGGSVEDTLTVDTDTTLITPFTSVSEICSWRDGTMTNDVAPKHPILAAHSDDIHTITSRATTIMLRFKLESLSGDTFLTNMCTQNNGKNSGFSLFVKADGTLYAQNYWNSSGGNTTYELSGAGAVGIGEWINLVITIGPRTNSTDGLMSAYYSYEFPKAAEDWITGCTDTRINVSNTGIMTNDFALFARPIDSGNHGNGITTFDDIRIYKKILTIDEVTSVLTNGSFYGKTTDIKQNLVLHYDFEGQDIATALKDKANAGTASVVADDLVSTQENNEGLSFDIINGTVKAEAVGAGLKATPSTDTAVIVNSNTLFIRAKLEAPTTATYTFFTMNSTKGRPYDFSYYMNSDSTGCRFGVHTAERTDISGTKSTAFLDHSYDFTASDYLNIVAVSDKQPDGTLKVTYYYSYGEPQQASEWTVKAVNVALKNDAPLTTETLYLLTASGLNTAAGMMLDDVRLYNKALTLDEIATIIPNGSFDNYISGDIPVQLKGVQYADPAGDNHHIRFVAGINDIESYDSVGYEIIITNGTDAYKYVLESCTVYKSILAGSSSGITEVITAESLNTNYIVALTLLDVPETYDKYLVKPFVMKDGEALYGKITLVNRSASWNQN